MKQVLSITMLASFILIILAGCFHSSRYSKLEIEGDTIVVQERIGDDFHHLHDIKDHTKVRKAIDLIEEIRWENSEVTMAYPPHYKFHFEGVKMYSNLTFALWISPNKDQVELVVEGEGKYVQLNKSTSAELFEVIADNKLSEVE